MPQSYCSLIYHCVFSTKGRRPWLTPELRDRTFAYLGGAVRAEGGTAMIINGTEDHVHILAQLTGKKTVVAVLRDIKANSSGWIHRTFPKYRDFAWQSGYGAFTVSVSQIPRVRRYIAGQEKHHRRVTFQEEFVALLKAHGIQYDPDHLWD